MNGLTSFLVGELLGLGVIVVYMWFSLHGSSTRAVKQGDGTMLRCPCCGGLVNTLVCDEEGNIHAEPDYEAQPWSGLLKQVDVDDLIFSDEFKTHSTK